METQHIIKTKDNEYIPHPHEDIIENAPSRHHEEVIVEETPVAQRSIVILRSYQIVWFILGLIETLLVFRFVLKMIGASTVSGFTNFIYALSYPFAAPFIGVLPASVSGPSVIEWSSLIAMVVYLVAAYGVLELIRLLTPVHRDGHYSTRRTRYAV